MSSVEIQSFRKIPNAILTDQTSTVGEPSVTNNGKQILVTGNWYAARSTNNGSTWSYLNPAAIFPEVDGGFCCDQTLIYDSVNDLTFWILQYVNTTQGNTLRLAVKKGQTLGDDVWTLWDFRPTTINSGWKNQWLDYNHASVSSKYLYIGSNVFDNSDTFTRCVILRIPLSKLKSGQSISFDYFQTTKDFSLRCVQGAKDVMYFAAHGPSLSNNKIRVFSWPENSPTVTKRDIAISPWSGGNYVATCPDNTQWLSRTDERITGGWYANGVLGFLWTVNKRGTDRPFPHIRVVRIKVSDMSLIDEPDIWNASYAYAYPDVSVNKNGVVGIAAFYGGGTKYPSHLVGFRDDTVNKWRLKLARSGGNGPADKKWGDYITIRPHSPANTSWIACGYTLQNGKTQEEVEVHTVVFRKK